MIFFTKKSRNLFLTFKWKPGLSSCVDTNSRTTRPSKHKPLTNRRTHSSLSALTAERYVTAEGKE